MLGQTQREQDKERKKRLIERKKKRDYIFLGLTCSVCDNTLVQIPIWIALVLPITENLKVAGFTSRTQGKWFKAQSF